MRRRYNMVYENKESFSPWETYSDLYCGLLLVFVLLFFFAIYQYIDARERNDADTAALQKSMKEEQSSVLAIYKADLEDQEAAYQEKSEQLDKQKAVFAMMQADLEERTVLLDNQQKVIYDQKIQMELQQNQLENQKKLIEEQQELLDIQADQIEQIIGVRRQLIEELNEELNKNQIQIQADPETGAIAFESTILFAKDSNELIEEGREFFRKFIPVYLDALLQAEFQDFIAEIIIEGHTDDTGSYLHNLELSQQRAWSVAEYFLNDDCDFLEPDAVTALKSLVTVNGCADKAPVYQEDGTIDADKSRRVEIKFRLKDQEMLQAMDEILNKQE